MSARSRIDCVIEALKHASLLQCTPVSSAASMMQMEHTLMAHHAAHRLTLSFTSKLCMYLTALHDPAMTFF